MPPEEVVGRVFGVSPSQLDDRTARGDLEGWDSLGHVTLVLELEGAYGVSLSPAEALRMEDIGAIKRVLRERGVAW